MLTLLVVEIVRGDQKRPTVYFFDLFCKTVKTKMGQIWFQHQPIEIQVVPVDFFCFPLALMIAVQNICAVL